MKNLIKYFLASTLLINCSNHAQATIPGLHKVLSVIPKNLSAKLQKSTSNAPQIAINALKKTTKNTLILACATAGLFGGSAFLAVSYIAETYQRQLEQEGRFSKTTRQKLTNTPATIVLTGATIALSRYSWKNPYAHAGALGALLPLSVYTSLARIKTIQDYTGLENRHALAALNFVLGGALSIAPAHNDCSLINTFGEFLSILMTYNINDLQCL